MDGCGPCNETKPKWKKIQKMIKNSNGNRDDVVVAAINQKLFENLESAGKEPMGYPCLRYIKGPSIEEYEDCKIQNKDRSTESFINWIESKIQKQKGGRKTRRMRRGGKWSLKCSNMFHISVFALVVHAERSLPSLTVTFRNVVFRFTLFFFLN
jgi:hypothetical protein